MEIMNRAKQEEQPRLEELSKKELSRRKFLRFSDLIAAVY
jgi:hypothetical protein